MHGPQGCAMEPSKTNAKNLTNAQFGPWLRADDSSRRKPPLQAKQGRSRVGEGSKGNTKRWDSRKGSEPRHNDSSKSRDFTGQSELRSPLVADW